MGKAANMSAGGSSYKERSAYWDNIKGILILFVVFSHVIVQVQHADSSNEKVIKCIYQFHMPANVHGAFRVSLSSYSFILYLIVLLSLLKVSRRLLNRFFLIGI